jgi:hypothetical protein
VGRCHVLAGYPFLYNTAIAMLADGFAGAEDAGDEAQPNHDLDARVAADEPILEPGDNDLADAWWAH